MTTSTLTLTDFLLARIAEDEEAARVATAPDDYDRGSRTFYTTPGAHRDDWNCFTFNVPIARILAECEAKRRIVSLLGALHVQMPASIEAGLGALAAVYSDHPDYRKEWAL